MYQRWEKEKEIPRKVVKDAGSNWVGSSFMGAVPGTSGGPKAGRKSEAEAGVRSTAPVGSDPPKVMRKQSANPDSRTEKFSKDDLDFLCSQFQYNLSGLCDKVENLLTVVWREPGVQSYEGDWRNAIVRLQCAEQQVNRFREILASHDCSEMAEVKGQTQKVSARRIMDDDPKPARPSGSKKRRGRRQAVRKYHRQLAQGMSQDPK